MTGPANQPSERLFGVNRRYNRRFVDPVARPSNQAGENLFDAATRRRITELTTWLDGQAVVDGCEALLRHQQGGER